MDILSMLVFLEKLLYKDMFFFFFFETINMFVSMENLAFSYVVGI